MHTFELYIPVQSAIYASARRDHAIQMIKALREMTGLGLKEAKDIIMELKNTGIVNFHLDHALHNVVRGAKLFADFGVSIRNVTPNEDIEAHAEPIQEQKAVRKIDYKKMLKEIMMKAIDNNDFDVAQSVLNNLKEIS